MKEELPVEEELSLSDIFRTLLSKIKLLIVVLLAGVLVGGATGALLTMNTHYYGTEIQFYVNPKEKEEGANESTYGVYGAYGAHVMDNMIKLLESDLFTEQLMLRGKTLPDKGLSAELDRKIDEANAKQVLAAPLVTAAEEAEEIKDDAVASFNATWQNEHKDEVFNVKAYEQGKYSQAVNEAYELAQEAIEDAEEKKELADEATKTYEEAKVAALWEWRAMKSYKEEHEKFSKSVEYSYLATGESSSSVSNLAKSFIYVKISVLSDEEFAKEILTLLRKEVASFIAANMIVPAGYVGTSCEETTTRSMIELTNEGYMLKSAITYGLLAGVLSMLVAAAIVVIIDRSDKRLRDHDLVSKQFNIPVLGVIPSIPEEVLNEWKHLNEEKGGEA